MIPRKPADPEKLRLKMAGLCARSEHCRFEIREKLLRAGLPSSTANDILDYLENERFIDDARYARCYANDKVRFARWGRRKIRVYLAQKRISSAIAAEALDEIDEKEYARALADAAEAKARNLDLTDFDDRRRLYRHLISRGFESGLISRRISSMVKKLRDQEE